MQKRFKYNSRQMFNCDRLPLLSGSRTAVNVLEKPISAKQKVFLIYFSRE